ncbi:unnamed protein product [Prunus armeniaca]
MPLGTCLTSKGIQFKNIRWNIRSHYKKGALAVAVSALGIENKNDLVVYDGKGIYSAARSLGSEYFDGGLPRCHASGSDVESSTKDADPGEDNQHTSSKDVESHGRVKGGSVLHGSVF